jgi:hypothetical protein
LLLLLLLVMCIAQHKMHGSKNGAISGRFCTI